MPRPNPNRSKKPKTKKIRRRSILPPEDQALHFNATEAYPYEEEMYATVPTRWVKFITGLFLLPVAWILTETFFTLFTQATVAYRFWATEEFWFFSLGFILWLIAFLGLPKPLLIYVFGHELTHAVWVWLMGGKVSRFRVGRDGGEILTDKTNFLIALAPYFFPIYSIFVVTVFGILSIFYDLTPFYRWLYGLLGITWSFHLTFTCWVIPKGQSDITDHGTFFSLLWVYIINIILLLILLVIASPTVSWVGLGDELLNNAVAFSKWATNVAKALIGHL